MNIYKFNPVIYPYMLWIAIDKSPSELPTYLHEYSGKPIQFIETDTCQMKVKKTEVTEYRNALIVVTE